MNTIRPLRALYSLALLLLFVLVACGQAEDVGSDVEAPRQADQAQVSLPPAAVAGYDACGQPAPVGAPFLDVGHAGEIIAIVRSGDRVVSQDDARWILWDAVTLRAIASGRATDVRSVDLAGDTVLTPSASGIDLRSAVDGRVLTSISVGNLPGIRHLANDASYVYVGDARSLRAWDRSGRLQFEHAGNYEVAQGFAGSATLQIAVDLGTVVETFALGGQRTISPPYNGRFHSWFLDGGHFITTNGTVAWVYTASGALVNEFPIQDGGFSTIIKPPVVGMGPYVWIGSPKSRLSVYRIDSLTPIETLDGWVWSGSDSGQPMFAVTRPDGEERLFVLAVNTATGAITRTDVPAPNGLWLGCVNDAHGAWACGDTRGDISISGPGAGATSLSLGCGRPISIAGAPDRLAVLTSDRKIRVFDLTSGRRRLLRTIDIYRDVWRASLEFAGDGRYLVSRGPLKADTRASGRSTLQVFDLKREEGTDSWPAAVDLDLPGVEFVTTAHGDHVASNACSGYWGEVTCSVHVSKLDGTGRWQTPSFTTKFEVPLFKLAPDGLHIAVTQQPLESRPGVVSVRNTSTSTTLIYDAQQALVGAVQATAVAAWIDSRRLLVRSGDRVQIVDLQGQVVSSPPGSVEPRTGAFRADDPDYFSGFGYVYRTTDASLVFDPARFYELPGREDALAEMRKRFTGHAIVGDKVALGVEQLIHLEPFR